jgi:hypothetical protein
MPKLGQYLPILDSVFFLYHSRADAEGGKKFGGTGFIAGVPAEGFPGHFHWVGVTNWHNACQSGASVVRVNVKGGDFDVLEFGPEDWHFIPGGPDVAATVLPLQRQRHQAHTVGLTAFVTEEKRRANEIDVGDDVLMVGRFVDYDGVETNRPALRFGNISIMDAAVKQSTGYAGRSIVLDMHSRTGFSGSPVFVYRTPGSHFARSDPNNLLQSELFFGHTFLFLGMHWGQFPEKWQLRDGKITKEAEEGAALITDGKYVSGLSGMTCVIPADDILKVLELPALTETLREKEARWRAEGTFVRASVDRGGIE